MTTLINWETLRKQKMTLLCLKNLTPEQDEHIAGVIHLLDHLQDHAVASGEATEGEVFGETNEEEDV